MQRPTTLTKCLQSNLIGPMSSPAFARTFRSRRLQALSPALVNSPLTFTSTQRDLRTSRSARPCLRRTASSSFPRARHALQGHVAKRGCHLPRARSRHPLVRRHVQSRRSCAAPGRTTPPHRPRRLLRQRALARIPRSWTNASLPRSRRSCSCRTRWTAPTTTTRLSHKS